MKLLFVLWILAAAAYKIDLIADSSFENSFLNGTNMYWEYWSSVNKHTFCMNNNVNICPITAYSWALARKGRWFTIFEGYGLFDATQQVYQSLNFNICNMNLYFEFYLKMLYVGNDNSLFTINYVSFHSILYPLFEARPTMYKNYLRYTLYQKNVYIDDCGPGTLIFTHKGYANADVNITHYMMDNVHLYADV